MVSSVFVLIAVTLLVILAMKRLRQRRMQIGTAQTNFRKVMPEISNVESTGFESEKRLSPHDTSSRERKTSDTSMIPKAQRRLSVTTTILKSKKISSNKKVNV